MRLFFFILFFFYINATVLLMMTLTTLFRAQAQFLIMLPCVLKEESNPPLPPSIDRFVNWPKRRNV